MMKIGDRNVHHSARLDFGNLLRRALHGGQVYAALGPIYDVDPAAEIMAPFIRSAREIGIDPDWLSISSLAPEQKAQTAISARKQAIEAWSDGKSELDWTDVEHWTRAGLVLEIASRIGIPLAEGTKAHVKWKLRGTVTGRFGVESEGGLNPLVIHKDKRHRICPGSGRHVAVLDFRAMDLCSIVSLFPTLSDLYAGTDDLHGRTAELVGVEREVAKKELFVFAYGGHSSYEQEFRRRMPEVYAERGPALARKVQERSAIAFKAGLSRALPLLWGNLVRPMFTVHDELVLDVLSEHVDGTTSVAKALEDGASERIGRAYKVGVKFGSSYGEAKEP